MGRPKGSKNSYKFKRKPESPETLAKRQERRRIIPLEVRFWAKVDKTETCWLWKGANCKGYGVMGIGKATEGNIRAARLSWELHFGEIPEGFEVCHSCDNPPCVRPDHLFLGTQKDNVLDAIGKGRQINPPRKYGEEHGMAKLTTVEVLQIRQELKVGNRQTDIAAHYNVTQPAISLIKLGKNWGWL